MAAIPYLIFMIIFILILTILNDVFSLMLYDLFLIYVATNLSDVLDVPSGAVVITELILGMLILITVYKIVIVSGNVKKRLGRLSLTEEQ